MNVVPDRDLFGPIPGGYPDRPGHKGGETSTAAARQIAPHAATVRANALAEYCGIHPAGMTADECARRLGASILTVRPRVSELRAGGWLEPTPQTRANADSGHGARVWRATRAAMEASR